MTERRMIEFMAITDDPATGAGWHAAGIDRIMIDLETYGKAERQQHRDTVKSNHMIVDIVDMRAAVPDAHVVARCEPVLMPGWAEHIERVLAAGPSTVMVPMVSAPSEVEIVVDAVRERAGLIVMIETAAALERVDEIASLIPGETLFVGLNDLHIQFGHRFMFEPLAEGHVEAVADASRDHKLEFGFGGLARPGTGLLDSADIVREHVRLGSSLAILARSFFGAIDDPLDVEQVRSATRELREVERAAWNRSATDVIADARKTAQKVRAVAEQMSRRI